MTEMIKTSFCKVLNSTKKSLSSDKFTYITHI